MEEWQRVHDISVGSIVMPRTQPNLCKSGNVISYLRLFYFIYEVEQFNHNESSRPFGPL